MRSHTHGWDVTATWLVYDDGEAPRPKLLHNCQGSLRFSLSTLHVGTLDDRRKSASCKTGSRRIISRTEIRQAARNVGINVRTRILLCCFSRGEFLRREHLRITYWGKKCAMFDAAQDDLERFYSSEAFLFTFSLYVTVRNA